MSAEFENGVFGSNRPAWHGLGTVVEDDVLTAAQVMEYVPQLGMHVELVAEHVTFAGRKIETGGYAIVREDGTVLGKGVSDGYQIVSNFEAFDWCDNIMGDGKKRTAKYHTAGTLKGGSIAWLLAKFNDQVRVGGVKGEEVDFYLLIGNRFDGHGAAFAKVVKERVVCKNTFDVARGESGREFKVWHTASAQDKMAQASQVLEIVEEERRAVEEIGGALISKKLSDAEFKRFLDRLVPLPKIVAGKTDRAAKTRQEARDVIASLYTDSPNLQNVQGTAWAAYNAVTEWFDHVAATKTRGTKDDEAKASENRFLRILRDTEMKDTAMKLLLKA